MKDFFLTDAQIKSLIDEPKQMDKSLNFLKSMKNKKGRYASVLQNSHEFTRQNSEDKWLVYVRLNKEIILIFL